MTRRVAIMNSLKTPKSILLLSLVLWAGQERLTAQKIEFARVTSKRVERTAELRGEIYSYLTVQLHAKVAGYVDNVLVDRGSFVKEGQLLIQLSAPEMLAHITQAQ